MTIKAKEVLRAWESTYGRLSDNWRSAFLTDNRTKRLTRLDAEAVRFAIAGHRKLDGIMKLAIERQSVVDKRKRAVKPRNSRSRYSGGHFPHQPSDTVLHKRIGPTQSYSDDF